LFSAGNIFDGVLGCGRNPTMSRQAAVPARWPSAARRTRSRGAQQCGCPIAEAPSTIRPGPALRETVVQVSGHDVGRPGEMPFPSPHHGTWVLGKVEEILVANPKRACETRILWSGSLVKLARFMELIADADGTAEMS